MNLGMVGLGRMGANMTERLREHGHTVETYARTNPERTANSLVDLAGSLPQPRVVWLMIPAGDPTEHAFQTLLGLLEDGDVIVDGGNSNFRDSQRRAEDAKKRSVAFLDAGVSGGIWGLKEGYCVMVGGDADAFAKIEPFVKDLTEPGGYAHVGPSGAGHFVKMVHNGIEYGMMQSIAEGFEIMQASEFPVDLEQGRGALAARLGRPELAARPARPRARAGSRPGEDPRLRRGLGRGPLDGLQRDRRERSGAGDHACAVRALRFAAGRVVRGEGERGAPQPVRGPCRESRRRGVTQNPLREGLRLPRTPDPCVLVIFGASGDLTQRKLFPAVYSLAARNLLPERFAIVGVARSEETDAEFRARMKEGVREFSRDPLDEKVWRRLAAGMRYLSADFADEGGEDRLVELLAEIDEDRGTAGNRVFYFAVPPSAISVLGDRLGRRRSMWNGWTRLIVEKPFGSDRESARALNRGAVRLLRGARDLPHRPLPR